MVIKGSDFLSLYLHQSTLPHMRIHQSVTKQPPSMGGRVLQALNSSHRGRCEQRDLQEISRMDDAKNKHELCT